MASTSSSDMLSVMSPLVGILVSTVLVMLSRSGKSMSRKPMN